MLQEHGAIIIDCDEIARDVVVPGTDAYNRIVDYFGSEVVQADRTLDRAKLGEMVFGSPMKRKALNSITSQPIFWAVIRRIFHEMYVCHTQKRSAGCECAATPPQHRRAHGQIG